MKIDDKVDAVYIPDSPSRIKANDYNQIKNEIQECITEAGLTPTKDVIQLPQALKILTAQSSAEEVAGIEAKIPAEASETNQLADKQFVQDLTSALNFVQWVDSLPETGESKYIYAVPREETDTEGKPIAALYLWDGTEWRGAGAFSLNIDPDTLATKAELAGYLPLASKAVANGVASLDANAKVPSAQIPVATASTLGGVKVDGTTITATADGVISATGGSGSGFDFEGTKAEFDAAVAAGTITEDIVSLITDDVSGDTVATKAELQAVDRSKADTSLSNVLANIDYVVESKTPTADDPTWYRKYKSGWLEQGGLAKSNADVTVTLLKPFADTNYSVQCTNRRLSTSDGWGWIFVLNMTTTSFIARACYAGGDITDINAMWEAKGMGAN